MDRGGHEQVAAQVPDRPKERCVGVAGNQEVPGEARRHHQRSDPVVGAAVPREQADARESRADDEVEHDPEAAVGQEVGLGEQWHEREPDRRG
jgi:hypothetical protein